ncbi:CRAL-TRIO domain-containing protein [Elsinoe ampelina]|uniref:CRAL-TRIO domain-containing protein n=1 Tax=Elsinoe ampelina TaxID=302913 RepID=A0A6A6GFB3_9PEZI|nr:CRAL-TRIO domain-containing protein [Elsinoe ampelina]
MATKEDIQASEALAYPTEHIGHLKPQHEEALAKFKEFCKEKGYYKPADGTTPASHDDETMLRYLRARKYNVQEAWTQFKDTENWRKDNQIDKLYDRIDVHEYDNGRRLYPQWTGRRDKRGIPLYVFEVAGLTSKAVAAYESASHKPGEVESKLPPKMLRLFALYENLCNFALPLCSYMPERKYPETPVSQSSNIVDISNVSLKQFWNLKNHMQDASQLATAYYPETLDRIFVIGAPAFFPTVWGWIKRWFDPITVSKIFILSKATTLATLEEFIDRANIPKKYGGELEFEFGDLPNVEPGIDSNLKWINPSTDKNRNTFPTGPIRWGISPTTGAMTATAVGTVDGKPRSVEVASIVNLPPDPSQISKTQRPSTPPSGPLPRLPSARDTHPPTPPPGEVDLSQPPSGTTTPASSSPGPASNGPTSAPSDDKSRDDTTDTVRTGTSSTRFEQQSSTHGHGQLEASTPDVRRDEHGDQHGVMEPKTVSQAPKEHPLPPQEEVPGGPGIVAQVKATVSTVAETVIGAVGIDHGDKDVPVAGAGERDASGQGEGGELGVGNEGSGVDGQGGKRVGVEGDEEVERARDEQVEEYLRSKSRSEQGRKVND